MSERVTLPEAMPVEGPLVDTFGRIADDLRISVTDKCNLRCTYCMPAEGLAWLPKAEILTYEEIARLVGLFQMLGVRTIRFTEYMPLDADHGWERDKVMPSREVLARIAERFPLIAIEHDDPSPATSYRFADGAPGT